MRNIAVLGLICALGLLPGCGQKGPLVLPDAQKHKPVITNPAVPPTGAPATATPPPAATQAPTSSPTQAPPAAAPDSSSQTKDDKSSNAASTP
jgi:predicted small lipoprotein YifL